MSFQKVCLSLAAVVLAMLIMAGAQSARAQTVFGFNYWPGGFSCSILDNAYWTPSNKEIVKRDLDQMSSFGCEVIRLMVWPESSGFFMLAGTGPGGGKFTSEFENQTDHLPEFLGFCRERDIKVIFCLGNTYFGGNMWGSFYGDNDTGWNNFMLDSLYWSNGFIDKIEASPYADTILFYDYENEWNRNVNRAASFIATIYDGCPSIPAGKRGCSILNIDTSSPYSGDDIESLKSALGARTLDFVDYHSYPGIGFNSDIEGGYDSAKVRFPGATVLLGEFGRQCATSGLEDAQVSTVVDVTTRARAKGIPYLLHWMFWDNAPPAVDQTDGWGYDDNTLKDVYGSMSSLLNRCANPDMETVSGGVPTGWTLGSSDGANTTFVAMGASDSDAACNDYYGRIQRNADSGSVWIVSDPMSVTPGERLFVNAYLRASMVNVGLTVVEYDASATVLQQTDLGDFTLSGWSWNNYLGLRGPWNMELSEDTHSIALVIHGTSPSSGSILDVDAVSAWTRPAVNEPLVPVELSSVDVE